MSHRPYPNAERAHHQLDRHADETPPARQPRPLSPFEKAFFEGATAAARAGGVALAAMANGFRRPQGGRITPSTPSDGHLVILSPGRQITDPDEAEALGLTADARRMRGKPTA
jgi:hypothetical protein